MAKRRFKKKRKVWVWIIYIVLRVLVVATMIAQIFNRNYYAVFQCCLTLVLFMIPAIAEHQLNVSLPTTLEVIIILFIFSAEILGEIQSFYTIFEQWDTMLHIINGFLMAAIGFAMIDILNQNPHIHFSMSPVFVAFVAFCFSMTIGVLWEFFEFSMDFFTLSDMQKDVIYHAISSVRLNESGLNSPVRITDIGKTIVYGLRNGVPAETVIEGGYLDIGVYDTVKDMFVNCLGAIVFSVIGAFYIKGRGKNVAEKFIPKLRGKKEQEEE